MERSPTASVPSSSATDSGAVASSKPSEKNTRRSLVSGGAFALGNAGQRVFTFLLLPVYTAVLTPSEYGRLGLLVAIQGGLTIAFSAGLEVGVFRRYFSLESEPRAQGRFVASAWMSLAAGVPLFSAFVVVALFLFVPKSNTLRPEEAALAVLCAASYVVATVVPLTVLRAERRLRSYLVLTLAAGALTALLTIVLVVVMRLGVVGFFAGTLAANLLILVTALYIVPWRYAFPFDRSGMRQALGIALPLIPHTLSHWSLILLDRAMLALIVTPAALGVYTLASNLALPALVLVLSLNQGFMPNYARAQNERDLTHSLRNHVTAQIMLVILIGCAISLLAPCVVELIAPSYGEAVDIVPWLVLGYVFLGIYNVPMNIINLTVGRTKFVWVFSGSAAVLNLALIYFTVPSIGLPAAGVASALAYLVLLAFTLVYAKTMPVTLRIDWRHIIGGAAMLVGLYVVATLFAPDDTLLGALGRVAALSLATLGAAHMSGIRIHGAMIAQLRRAVGGGAGTA